MPFKLPLPKLSKMKYNFAPVLHNKYVLYAFLAMTLVRIVFFVNNGDMASVITLGLVGFITSFFSKNMIVILCIALTVSSLLTYGIRSNTHEGLENKDENAKDKKDKKDKNDENSEDKMDENSEDKMDENSDDKKDENNKTGEVNSNETSDKTKDEVKEQYDNLKKEYPEFKEVHAEIMKGIERMDPLLQKAESFVNKYSKLKQ